MHIRTAQQLLGRFAIFFALWLVLTGAASGGIAFGLAASAAAAWSSGRLSPVGQVQVRLLSLAMIAPGFFLRALAGGIDVARRAFDPRLPLRPGWIAYRARLPAGVPRVILGGEISLLPGTLVAGEEQDRLLVHCLDTTQPVIRQIAAEEERFEAAVRS